MSAHAFADEKSANELLQALYSILKEISHSIDLTDLDGVTVSYQYQESLYGLDRGYATDFKLTPTSGEVIGMAMAPRVLREKKLKTHLVLNANYVVGALWDANRPFAEVCKTEAFQVALHTLAHEAAHVEVTSVFDNSFPGYLLRHRHTDILESERWSVILPCWEEYAVCRICGDLGYDPSGGYADLLSKKVTTVRDLCRVAIREFRSHGNVEEVANQIFGLVGDLLKFASYFLGASSNLKRDPSEYSQLVGTVVGSWFEDTLTKLKASLEDIFDSFGKWQDFAKFEIIGDIFEELAVSLGVKLRRMPNSEIYIEVPFETAAADLR